MLSIPATVDKTGDFGDSEYSDVEEDYEGVGLKTLTTGCG